MSPTYRPSASVSVRPVDNELVLLDGTRSRYFVLTPSATVVWETIAAAGTVADATTRLVQEFAVDPHVAEQDVAQLVDDLIRANLVEPVAR